MKVTKFKVFPGWHTESIFFPKWPRWLDREGRLPFFAIQISYHGYVKRKK